MSAVYVLTVYYYIYIFRSVEMLVSSEKKLIKTDDWLRSYYTVCYLLMRKVDTLWQCKRQWPGIF